ncbi:hypothetical protein HOLleu_33932 [Holothuria leucospilota]|uniref:Uncharacterized protein n=1 Tax=Holothuria leucospilota TaxID=206669 RepID=A0A9Q0YPJ4_HOLLE|nr:hypothetical protein HOLleu_33932 [Holothuria leucospilota]
MTIREHRYGNKIGYISDTPVSFFSKKCEKKVNLQTTDTAMGLNPLARLINHREEIDQDVQVLVKATGMRGQFYYPLAFRFESVSDRWVIRTEQNTS